MVPGQQGAHHLYEETLEIMVPSILRPPQYLRLSCCLVVSSVSSLRPHFMA